MPHGTAPRGVHVGMASRTSSDKDDITIHTCVITTYTYQHTKLSEVAGNWVHFLARSDQQVYVVEFQSDGC